VIAEAGVLSHHGEVAIAVRLHIGEVPGIALIGSADPLGSIFAHSAVLQA
jgi:hypothetical protein